jgi:sulfur-oxidizing protein SoxB
MDRREFLRLLAIAGMAAGAPACASRSGRLSESLYSVGGFGNARLIHMTDTHAQLLPVYYREPNVNLGLGEAYGRVPHLVGKALLEQAGVSPGTPEAHAFTHLDFADAAARFGKVGGFAYLKTLVRQLRAEAGDGNSLLLDGGDTWQGSGTAYWTRGRDMVGACNLLGVDIMTGHWEFTYQDKEVLDNIASFDGEFVAQNVRVSEEALFDGAQAYDEDVGYAFKPYTIRSLNGKRVAVIGQAFPYTPIANPQRFMPDWTFGIRAGELQQLVDAIRSDYAPHAVVLLSHNGMDVDIKLGAVVSGIDVILGGHTHDGVPMPVIVNSTSGRTIVTNAGSNGKFLGVLDLDLGDRGVRDFRYRLLPVFSNLLDPDPEMQAYISEQRAPYAGILGDRLSACDLLLYRRGNFNGTFDQLICDAQRAVGDAQISLSPGFRWGTSLLPGQDITMEDVLNQTCITYPETYVRGMSGEQIKLVLEDVADNLFNPDPFYQQGGDMVRVGGMDYFLDPAEGPGKRISEMQLDDGTPIQAGKIYKVAGWATVGEQAPGPPIWDVVAEYLRASTAVQFRKLNTPILKLPTQNPGLVDYAGKLRYS